mmetsp:Transcript_54011/g.128677  ORF Transcript_54011/g.128677 Transcript_54011/m.128677 type:complete len:222 (+) Transcript_54011:246-911(+)
MAVAELEAIPLNSIPTSCFGKTPVVLIQRVVLDMLKEPHEAFLVLRLHSHMPLSCSKDVPHLGVGNSGSCSLEQVGRVAEVANHPEFGAIFEQEGSKRHYADGYGKSKQDAVAVCSCDDILPLDELRNCFCSASNRHQIKGEGKHFYRHSFKLWLVLQTIVPLVCSTNHMPDRKPFFHSADSGHIDCSQWTVCSLLLNRTVQVHWAGRRWEAPNWTTGSVT